MKKSILSLLAVAAMVSCTQNDMDLKGSDEQAEIKLKSTALSIDAAATRVPFEGTIGNPDSFTALVYKSLADGDYQVTNTAAGVESGEMEFADETNEVGFKTPKYFPADKTADVYLCGLYPTTNWTLTAASATAAEYTFDGKTDVMAAAQVSTNKTAALAGTFETLAFKHLLAKLRIKAIADPSGDDNTAATAAKEVWGTISKIELKKIQDNKPNNKVMVNMKTGVAQFTNTNGVGVYQMTAADTYSDTPFETLTVDIPEAATYPVNNTTADIAAAATDIAYSLVPPFAPENKNDTEATADLVLMVYTSKYTSGFPVYVALPVLTGSPTPANNAGLYYVITLTFKGTIIEGKATVQAWTDGGSADGTIE